MVTGPILKQKKDYKRPVTQSPGNLMMQFEARCDSQGLHADALKMGQALAHAIWYGNFILRGVNGHSVSKFDVKPHSLPTSILICHSFPKFEEKEAK